MVAKKKTKKKDKVVWSICGQPRDAEKLAEFFKLAHHFGWKKPEDVKKIVAVGIDQAAADRLLIGYKEERGKDEKFWIEKIKIKASEKK